MFPAKLIFWKMAFGWQSLVLKNTKDNGPGETFWLCRSCCYGQQRGFWFLASVCKHENHRDLQGQKVRRVAAVSKSTLFGVLLPQMWQVADHMKK